MSRISEIDKNFVVQSTNDREDTVYFKATDPRFEINGVFYEDGKFRRLPETVAKETSWGVLGLSVHTAGGRLRFKTNSKYIILKATGVRKAGRTVRSISSSLGIPCQSANAFSAKPLI